MVHLVPAIGAALMVVGVHLASRQRVLVGSQQQPAE